MQKRSRLILLGVVTLMGLLFLWRVRTLLAPLFYAAILSYVLMPFVQRLQHRGVPPSISIILSYVIVGLVGSIIFFMFMPFLRSEAQSLLQSLPEQTNDLTNMAAGFLERIRHDNDLPEAVRRGIEQTTLQLEFLVANMVERIIYILVNTFTSLFYVVLTPIVAFFIMRDWPSMKRRFLHIFPSRYRDNIHIVATSVHRVLSGFIRGQLLVCIIVGVLTTAGLAFLSVPYAIVAGLIAGLFEVIPYFGPIVGGVPALFFALFVSPATALWAIVLLFIINQFVSFIIAPKVVGTYVGLHPLTVMFVILSGAELAGIVGMFVAVPLTAVLKVIGSHVIERFQRDESPTSL